MIELSDTEKELARLLDFEFTGNNKPHYNGGYNMKIELLEVSGLGSSMRAMRNPKNSHDMSTYAEDTRLSRQLFKAGGEHCKHLRMIDTWWEITAPRYFWIEFDTYKFIDGVSCSTMHKIHERDLTLDDFEYNTEDKLMLSILIHYLNDLIHEYRKNPTPELLGRMKKILPESYLQKRTVKIGYQQLANMYNQRHNHRLPEWRLMCTEILKEVPMFKDLTGIGYVEKPVETESEC